MNAKHVGDKFDDWKRSVFRVGAKERVLGPIRVIPMFTGDWSEDLLGRYFTALAVRREAVVSMDPFSRSHSGNTTYFETVRGRLTALESQTRFDLFIDPDTGIGDPACGGERRNHRVSANEVASLVTLVPESIVLVYDQTCPNNVSIDAHGQSQCKWFTDRGLHALALARSGQSRPAVQLVLVSASESRISGVSERWAAFQHEGSRVVR